MYSRRTNASIAMTFVECDREEDVRRFGSAIGNERLIGRVLETWVLKINVRVAMPRRRQVDEPPAIADKRRNPVDQDKVAQVIRAELRFESIGCVAERCGHHAGIGDDHVERFRFRQQPVGAGTHAFQVGKIEFNQF
jgi:hypothetical protein